MDSAVAELRKEGFRINGINVRNDLAAAERFGIKRLPIIYFDQHRKEVRRSSGNMSISSLRPLWLKPLF